MKKQSGLLLILVIGLFTGLIASAQGAPPQMDLALNDLSNRVGQPLGINNLSNWRWGQETYADTSLGCDSVEGTGSAIAGYQFTLTYNGVTYDYRVSADNSIVLLCGQIDPNQPTPTPPLDEQYSNQLCVESEGDLPYMRTRLNVGLNAEVSSGVLNLRAQPNSNAEVLQQIPVDVPFRIEGGPSCVDNFVWWYINVNGQLGYIAEGQDGEYFVEPERPDPIPSREILNTENIANLQQFATVVGNFVPHVAWSPDGLTMALPGALGSDSIWLYPAETITLLPQLIEADETMTTLEFRPNGTQVMFGTAQGTVHLWQVVPDPNINIFETLFLNTHQRDITSLAFSPDGGRFISAGQSALTTANVDKTWAAIVWDISTVSQLAVLSGHNGLIRDVAWSPDGNTIVTGADDSTVRFWDALSGEVKANLEVGAPVTSVAYSPNGQFVAVGLSQADGRVLIFDSVNFAQITEYQVTSAGISSLAFSPDATMLIVGGSDNTFAVWSTQSDQPLTALSVEDNVRHVSFSPDGSFMTVTTNKPAINVYGVPFVSG